MASVSTPITGTESEPGLHQKRLRIHAISFAIFGITTGALLCLAYMATTPYWQAMGMFAGAPGAVAAIQLYLVIYHLRKSDVARHADSLADSVAMHEQRVRQHAWLLAAGLLAIGAAIFSAAWRVSPREGMLLFGFLIVFVGGNGYLVDRHIGLGRKFRERLRKREARIRYTAARA